MQAMLEMCQVRGGLEVTALFTDYVVLLALSGLGLWTRHEFCCCVKQMGRKLVPPCPRPWCSTGKE